MRIALVMFATLVGGLLIGAATPEPEARIEWADALLVQLQVAELDRAVAFYSEVLGMEVQSVDRELGWARISSGIPNVTIGLGIGRAGSEPEGSGSVSINFGVNNLDETREILEEKGVEFVGPTVEIPGVVRLADFHDPDGNMIRLAGHSAGFGAE